MKTCIVCNKEFAGLKNSKICSDVCDLKHRTIVCNNCEKEFVVLKFKGKNTQKFCTYDCWVSFNRKINIATKYSTCDVCGNKFRNPPSVNCKTCSFKCRGALQRRNNPKRPKNCKYCNKLFDENLYSKKKFCDMLCFNRYYANTRKIRKAKPEGFRSVTSSGYIMVKTDGVWKYEHRHVFEKFLGRALNKNEKIHHKNGNRQDNALSNLELWKLKKDPPGIRAADYHCAGCNCTSIEKTI